MSSRTGLFFSAIAVAVGAAAFSVIVFPSIAQAGQVALEWDANTEPDLSGYKIYSGTQSGNFTRNQDVGNVTTIAILGLDDCTTYYHAATAYDRYGNESGYSNEVSHFTALPLNMSITSSQPGIVNIIFQRGCPGGQGYTISKSDGTTNIPVIDESDGDLLFESHKVCSNDACAVEISGLDPGKTYAFSLRSVNMNGVLSSSEQTTIEPSSLAENPQIVSFAYTALRPLELWVTTTVEAYCNYEITGSSVSIMGVFSRTGNNHHASVPLPDGMYHISATCRNRSDQVTSTAALSVEIDVNHLAASLFITTDGQRLYAEVNYTGAPITLDLEVNGLVVSRMSSLSASGQITIPIRRLSSIIDGTNAISVVLRDGINTVIETKTIRVPLNYEIIGDFEGTPEQEAAQWQIEACGITNPFAQTSYSIWNPPVFASGEEKKLTEGNKTLKLLFNEIPPQHRAAIRGNSSFDPREYSETRLTVYNPYSIAEKPLGLAILYRDRFTGAQYATPVFDLLTGWNSIAFSHDKMLKYPSVSRDISEVFMLSDPTVGIYNSTGNVINPGHIHLDKWLIVKPEKIVQLSYPSPQEALPHWQRLYGTSPASGGSLTAGQSGMEVTSNLATDWRGCIATSDYIVPDLTNVIDLQFRGYAATTDQIALVQLMNSSGEWAETKFPLGDASSAHYPKIIQTSGINPMGNAQLDLSNITTLQLCNYQRFNAFPGIRKATFAEFSLWDIFPPGILHQQ